MIRWSRCGGGEVVEKERADWLRVESMISWLISRRFEEEDEDGGG